MSKFGFLACTCTPLLLALGCGGGDETTATLSASETMGSTATVDPTVNATASEVTTDASSGSEAGTDSESDTTTAGPTESDSDATTEEPTTEATTEEPTTEATTEEPTTSESDSDSESTTTGEPIDECKVPEDDLDGFGECDQEAPPDSFNPQVQWTWSDPTDRWSIVTPLVANLTDDNDDGEIDLCDVPDVVVLAYPQTSQPGHIYVLDGETGNQHFQIAEEVHWGCSPALGDIDNDGLPEIVAYRGDALLAFEHDGTLKWERPANLSGLAHAVALADVDNDGDVEILVHNQLFDHEGNLVVSVGNSGGLSASVLADLDGDGDQEIIQTNSAYHHTGEPLYMVPQINPFGYPQVANLDEDPEPEVLIEAWDGISILEHDGTPKYLNETPIAAPPGDPWLRPSTVHDFDGDGVSEFAVSTGTEYAVYERDLTIVWTAPVFDASGDATGTAFDFLGDGIAEAMYGDEKNIHVFDGSGQTLLSETRTSVTHIEYPVVADIDNDGSAEIVVVSNSFNDNQATVKVIRDAEDRWIQARRIWNQHTYHVTNVREDGTIPQFETPSWEELNTYRTNVQIEGGSVCVPIPM